MTLCHQEPPGELLDFHPLYKPDLDLHITCTMRLVFGGPSATIDNVYGPLSAL